MTPAEERLEKILSDHQDQLLARWTGYEKILLFEIVRALDNAALGQMLAVDDGSQAARRLMLLGGARALHPLLQRVKGIEGGVPWSAPNREVAGLADAHLFRCGSLANLLRLAGLEQYGLATTSFVQPDRLILEIVNSRIEDEEREAVGEILGGSDSQFNLVPESPELVRRMDAYVGVGPNNLIRYDNDDDLIAYYRALAGQRAALFLEGEALPPDAVIGGRTFQRWLDAAAAASGRTLQHIAFALRLSARRPDLTLRNQVTLFVRRDDLNEVLLEANEPAAYAVEFMRALTFDEEHAAACIAEHEVLFPYYVDFGRDFVLLTALASLLNPVAAIVRHLRSQHRNDWDRAVARREEIFRADLRRVFPQPRFYVPQSGVRLRRTDGTTLTDIDAMLVDREFGTVALLQLKWHDIYSRSLKERNSRRLNLLGANQWVERVVKWVDGRSAAAVAAQLMLGQADDTRAPYLFVVGRYSTQFVQSEVFDKRAAWLSWGNLARLGVESRDTHVDVIAQIAADYRGGRRTGCDESEPRTVIFDYPKLTVELRIH